MPTTMPTTVTTIQFDYPHVAAEFVRWCKRTAASIRRRAGEEGDYDEWLENTEFASHAESVHKRGSTVTVACRPHQADVLVRRFGLARGYLPNVRYESGI